MTSYIALLRAVNVGGTGRLAMQDLARLCREAGFEDVRTYIASGNVVLRGDAPEAGVRAALEERLQAHAGRPVGVLVRTAVEAREVLARNPFPAERPDRVAVLFTDAALTADPLQGATGLGTERVRGGRRELFIFYPDGMGRSRLRLPAAARGTARNLNTLTKLVEMAGGNN